MSFEPTDEDLDIDRPIHHFNVQCKVVGLAWDRTESAALERFRRAVAAAVDRSGFELLPTESGDAFHSETCDCEGVAICDICGRVEPHDHTDDEYGTYYRTDKEVPDA